MKMKSIAVSFEFMTFFLDFNFLCTISVVDCSDNEFKCQDMTCIPKDKVCDDIPDCPFPDNSDEDNCPTTTPRPGPFSINRISFEMFITNAMFFPVFTDCGSNEYYCPSLNMCITCCSLVIQCNEVPISISCPDCPENGFRCDKSKLCIDSFSVCDGKNDCDDGSDERNCGNTV